MGRREAKNDLSGLEGDPCSGQGLGSPSVTARDGGSAVAAATTAGAATS